MSLKKDSRFLQGLALTYLSDRVELVTLPKKGNKELTHWLIRHDLKGGLWCGPAVISAITGEPTSASKVLIQKYRKNYTRGVTGTTAEEVEYALKRLGYKMDHAYLYGGKLKDSRPTLSKWLHTTAHERVENVAYLVSLAGEKHNSCGHWVMILGDRYICSISKYWVPLDKAMHKRRLIDCVYAIRKIK